MHHYPLESSWDIARHVFHERTAFCLYWTPWIYPFLVLRASQCVHVLGEEGGGEANCMFTYMLAVCVWHHQDGSEGPRGGWRRQQAWHSTTRQHPFYWRMTFLERKTPAEPASQFSTGSYSRFRRAPKPRTSQPSAPHNWLFTANTIPPPHPLGTQSWPIGWPSRPLMATASLLGWLSTAIFYSHVTQWPLDSPRDVWPWAWPPHPLTDCTASVTGPQPAAGDLAYTLERARRCEEEEVCVCV